MPGARSKPKKRKKALAENDLLAVGREHFAKDFPNPKRKGCPPVAQLQLLAEHPRKAKKSALDHIASCSPCYRTYSRFLHARNGRRTREEE